jgi:hypothetical protein
MESVSSDMVLDPLIIQDTHLQYIRAIPLLTPQLVYPGSQLLLPPQRKLLQRIGD